jgi:hypothetical protein
VEGLLDPTDNVIGFNVANGVDFAGDCPRSPAYLDWYFLSGSFTARNSSFKNMGDGPTNIGFMKSADITIGGSPTTGNYLDGFSSRHNHFRGL